MQHVIHLDLNELHYLELSAVRTREKRELESEIWIEQERCLSISKFLDGFLHFLLISL